MFKKDPKNPSFTIDKSICLDYYINQNLTLLEIAEIYKVSQPTIIKVFKNHNIPTPRKHIRYYFGVSSELIGKEYAEGSTIDQLATKYRVSTTYIKARLKDANQLTRTKKVAQLLRYKNAKACI